VIVPNNRLIFWAGCVMITAALAVAIMPGAAPICGTIVASFALIAMGDLLAALRLLDGVAAHFPDLARLTKDREGKINIEIDNEKETDLKLRIGIKFPAEIRSLHEYVETVLPEKSPRSYLQWPCVPVKRGNYVLENAHLETDSPLGLWAIRKVSQTRAEVRVYPNAMREQKKLAAIFLNRGTLGIHAQTQVGKGKEFEKLREYVHGDSYEDIHWKATARRGRPITKVFQIERTQELYVVIDASRLAAREVMMTGGAADKTATVEGTPPSLKVGYPQYSETTQLERFISAALVLGLVAQKQGDLFGVLAFDDQVRAFVRARSGKGHYGACREALYTLQPRMVNPDFGELTSFIRLRLRRRALLIFLANLDDPVLAENFAHNMDILSRHHLVLVNMISTPGVAPLFSGERKGGASGAPEVSQVDDIYRMLGGHILWQKLRELEKTLRRRGVSMSLLDNEMMAPQLVSQYINVKRRQIL